MKDLFDLLKPTPLAERMRPRTLEEVQGQEHLIGPGKPLSHLANKLTNIILWGPPGCGKTTIARLLAQRHPFEQISAVLSGVKDLRKITEQQKTKVVFVDEIHRWNKAQQDALLPHMEDGSIILIGATTENPSFSLIPPLMSRSKLFVLKPLTKKAIRLILQATLKDQERGLGEKNCKIEEQALDLLVQIGDGDARQSLNALEIASNIHSEITAEKLQELFPQKSLRHDQEEHYDCISAFIKSLRGSDPDAAVYYLARFYEAGGDLKFLTRRMIIFASEDIGNADPRALQIAVAGAAAFERIGRAEGWIPLSQVTTYLSTAPKSNASYMAYKSAKKDIHEKESFSIPLHLRNAPTKMMKNLGYGDGYEYAHNKENSCVSHSHLPKALANTTYYQPTERGYEKKIRERMNWLSHQKK